MTDPESTLPERESLPRHTTPTWEMELLISGATVFALLQLPEALDGALYRYMPQFERSAAVLVLLPYIYLMTAAYALIATFVLHLATRGYWVALVGMHSVYPDGVRWENLRWGPNYLATMRKRTASSPALIERADNRASKVFGYGIGFALLMIAPLVLGLVIALLAGAIYEFMDQRVSWGLVWGATFAVAFAPFGISVLIDRLLGRRIPAEGAIARGLRGIFGAYLKAGFSSFVSYPILMFISRMGTHRGTMAMLAIMFALTGGVLLQLMVREGDVRLDGYRYLPSLRAGSARMLDPAHYADQRTQLDSLAPLPFIPAEVIRGDHLRLFIPYRPVRDTPSLERLCPTLRDPLAGSATPDSRDDEVLGCMARLYQLALDDQPVVSPDLVFGEDVASGQRGVVAMLPIEPLGPGRHEVSVARVPLLPGAEQEPYRISFWRQPLP